VLTLPTKITLQRKLLCSCKLPGIKNLHRSFMSQSKMVLLTLHITHIFTQMITAISRRRRPVKNNQWSIEFYHLDIIQIIIQKQWKDTAVIWTPVYSNERNETVWCSCGCASLMYSFKYNQQDATVYNNFFITVYALHQRFSNFFQVGTTFISQNVLWTTLLLGLSNSLGLP